MLHCELPAAELAAELAFIRSGAEADSTIAGGAPVTIQALDDAVILKGWSPGLELRSRINAKTTSTGAAETPSRLLLNVSKSLGRSPITLRDDGRMLGAAGVNFASRLVRMADIAGPGGLHTHGEKVAYLPSRPLLRYLTACASSVSHDDFKVPSAGLLQISNNKHFRLVATDSYTLTEGRTGELASIEFALLVPRDAMSSIRSLIEETDDMVEISSPTPSGVVVRVGDRSLQFEQHAGKYPQVDRILSQKTLQEASLDPESAVEALHRVTRFMEKGEIGVRLSLVGQTLTLSATSGSGTASDVINVFDRVGGDVDVRIDGRYARAALQAVSSEDATITLKLNGEGGLIHFTNASEGVTACVMPMRL